MAVSFACTPAPAPAQEEQPQEEEPQDPDPQEPEEPEDPPVDPSTLKALVATVPVPDNNFIYESNPQFTIQINNRNEVPVSSELSVKVFTDKGKEVTVLDLGEITVPANTTIDKPVTLEYDFLAGFYKANCIIQKRIGRSVIFGIRPTEIDSAPDMQPDFTTFWEDAINELKALDMNTRLVPVPGKNNVYLVEMQSIPDSPSGDPVLIHAYLAEPANASASKKYPVLIHFEGYDTQKPTGKMYCPSGASDFIELYMSNRGQMINNRTAAQRSDGIDEDYHNIYGDWFAFNFGKRDEYYYRGAYMDCVQAVRFIATREGADLNNIFAEGKSQGGAFSYACAALSTEYPLAGIAPGVAFMGDFRDYFEIVSWPGNTAKDNKGSMTDDEMFAFLSYFDTKNLATRISCPIIANIGLKDTTCPPHTNIAPFNNALTPAADKEMYYYAEMGHDIPAGWDTKVKKFFKSKMTTSDR